MKPDGRPILFSAPMVRAVLAGTKTQTRRLCKDPTTIAAAEAWCEPILGGAQRLGFGRIGRPMVGSMCKTNEGPPLDECVAMFSPYGASGDRLWVREAWQADPPHDGTWASTQWAGSKPHALSEIPERFRHPAFCLYRAGWLPGEIRWRPSIHMPRWASRITLEVTGVRVERLQEISEADAKAEGCEACARRVVGLPGGCDSYLCGYRQLWSQINGKGAWEANPWVWVVEFKRC